MFKGAEKPARILIVEKDELYAMLLRRAFEIQGDPVQFESVSAIRDALRSIAASPPDLIIADSKLPDGQGLDLLQGSDDGFRLPVILMTEIGDEKTVTEAIAAGALDYVVKSDVIISEMPQIARRALREIDLIRRKRQAEEDLRRSEEQYRALVQSQGEGIGIVDAEERFVFANPAAEEIFGVDQGRLIGRSLKEFMTDAEYARIIEETGRRRSGERSTYDLEIIHPGGEPHVLMVTATPQVDRDGKYTGAFGVFRDITGMRRAVDALRESEERYRRLVEFLPHGVGLIQDRKFVFANPAAVKMLGFDRLEEMTDLLARTLLPEMEYERLAPLFKDVERGSEGSPWHFTTRIRRKDGVEVSVEAYVTVVTHQGKRALQIFIMDRSGIEFLDH